MGQSFDGSPIDANDHIAKLNPRRFCRLSFQHIHHDGLAFARFNARADAAIFSRLHEADVLHFGLREVAGVGVKLSQHGFDARFHQFAWSQLVDVEQIQFSERRLHDFELLRHLEVVVFEVCSQGQAEGSRGSRE